MNVGQLQPFAPLDGIVSQARSMFGDEDVPVRAFARRYIPVYGWHGIIAIAACFVVRCEDRVLCLRWQSALGGESPAAVVARAVVAAVVAAEAEAEVVAADRILSQLARASFAASCAATHLGALITKQTYELACASALIAKQTYESAYADERAAAIRRDIAQGEALIANAHREALEQRPDQADIDTFVDLACAVIARALQEE